MPPAQPPRSSKPGAPINYFLLCAAAPPAGVPSPERAARKQPWISDPGDFLRPTPPHIPRQNADRLRRPAREFPGPAPEKPGRRPLENQSPLDSPPGKEGGTAKDRPSFPAEPPVAYSVTTDGSAGKEGLLGRPVPTLEINDGNQTLAAVPMIGRNVLIEHLTGCLFTHESVLVIRRDILVELLTADLLA